MDAKKLGKRLRAIREKNALTQEAVEKAIALPHKAMTHVEAGVRNISSLELSKLADLFHVPIADLFSDPIAPEEDLLVALYRAAPGIKENPIARETIARCIHLCREGAFLEKLLDLSRQHTILSYPFPAPQTVGDAISQGERAADQERRRLGIGTEPIHDLLQLLTQQGIWAAGTELPAELSGLFIHHPNIGMAILVNAKQSHFRQRFSYAHEYAHALFDPQRTVAISNQDGVGTLIETRANAFAAAFLMPEIGIANRLRSLGKGAPSRTRMAVFDPVKEELTETEQRRSFQHIAPQDAALLAHHFGVSYQAMVHRLHSLRYFNREESHALLQAERTGKDYLRALNLFEDVEKPANSPQDRTLKASVAHFAIEAYRREEISRGRLLELGKLLQLPGDTLLRLALK